MVRLRPHGLVAVLGEHLSRSTDNIVMRLFFDPFEKLDARARTLNPKDTDELVLARAVTAVKLA